MTSDTAHLSAEQASQSSTDRGAEQGISKRVPVLTPGAVVEDVLEPVMEAMGYELVHVEWSGSGKHRRLIVYLDKLDPATGGFSLDDCTKMAPIISNALDAAEGSPSENPAIARVLSAPYVLEVSSPGIDRPLARVSHFRRFLGRRAKISTVGPLDPSSRQKNFNGRIEDVLLEPSAPQDDRAGTVILVDSDDGARYTIRLDQIRRANLIFEE